MNCAEKLLEPTIFFNLYTKSPWKSDSENPCRKRDLSPTWNLGIMEGDCTHNPEDWNNKSIQ